MKEANKVVGTVGSTVGTVAGPPWQASVVDELFALVAVEVGHHAKRTAFWKETERIAR